MSLLLKPLQKKNEINDREVDYLTEVLTHEKLIKKAVNDASEEVYKTFVNSLSDHYAKDKEEFYKNNRSAPKFDRLEKETDLYVIMLRVNSWCDIYLFYQDRVCKLLNKCTQLKDAGFSFYTEDYPGIFINYTPKK